MRVSRGADTHAKGRKGESGAGVLAREINTRREEASQNRHPQSGSVVPNPAPVQKRVHICTSASQPASKDARTTAAHPASQILPCPSSLAAFGTDPCPRPLLWSDRATKGRQDATTSRNFAPDPVPQRVGFPPLSCPILPLHIPLRALGHPVATYHTSAAAQRSGRAPPASLSARSDVRGGGPCFPPQMPRPDGADLPDATLCRRLVLSIPHPMGSPPRSPSVRTSLAHPSPRPHLSSGLRSAQCQTTQLPSPLFSVVMSYALFGRKCLCEPAVDHCDACATRPQQLNPPLASQRQSCVEMAVIYTTSQDKKPTLTDVCHRRRRRVLASDRVPQPSWQRTILGHHGRPSREPLWKLTSQAEK